MNTDTTYDKLEEDIITNDMKIEEILNEDSVENHLSELDSAIYNAKENVKTNNLGNNYSFIKDNIPNKVLIVSEREKKVFLPYSTSEINLYLEQYPNEYRSFSEVVKKEYVLPLDYYMKHPLIARFRESYSLIRDREAKSIIDAFKYALSIMPHSELNPVIIAACKTEQQLNDYMDCLSKNKLSEFKSFEIRFEITPLA